MNHCERSVKYTLEPLPDSVTVCATLDESGCEQIITELMIRRACEQIEADQLWQLSSKSLCHTSSKSLPAGGAVVLPFIPRN